MRFRAFLALVAAVSLLLLTTAPALAAENSTQPMPIANQTQTERIDENTVLLHSEYSATDDVARITLRSETLQTILVSDAGRFTQGGKIPVRGDVLRPGETATIELPVTEVDGYVGVAISTDATPMYAEILQQPTGDGLDILKALTSLQAWLAGAFVAFVWFAIAGWQVLRREGGRPEVAS
ncbi:hypothetical protein VB773_01040 [Haloarculaceae archaeon H-GB2-1]|nr:hypothetical protein [Haloarculaceae archaeon H-GB1-1]MEA5406305.1 hypothetical protein [Haloarculaceae archaeon H-GB2-1]